MVTGLIGQLDVSISFEGMQMLSQHQDTGANRTIKYRNRDTWVPSRGDASVKLRFYLPDH